VTLLDQERKALKAALTEDLLKSQGWTIDEQGRIKNIHGSTIFPIGFATALHKTLDNF